MAILRIAALLMRCFVLLPHFVGAQYLQDYRLSNVNGGSYYYQADATAQLIPVLNVEPYNVYLIYNCHYMREVCKNAEIFGQSARGQNLHPGSGIPNDVYGYDLNTGEADAGEEKTHQERRRAASCPSSWKKNHPCPESDGTQQKPMRHNGEWFFRELEPGTTLNQLMDVKVNNVVTKHSNIRYTCDEFPPATWVEGGNGFDKRSPSNTRCAALACSTFGETGKVKAEQNWQGFSHGLLRQQLEYYAAELDLDLLDHKSVIFFRLRTDDNGADAVPARVYVEKTVGGNAEMFDSDEIITQAKRNTRANSSIMGPGLAIEEIRARIAAGRGYEVLLHENMTVTHPDLARRSLRERNIGSMSVPSVPSEWGLADAYGNETVAGNLPKGSEHKSHSRERRGTAPLATNSTLQQLETARMIVDAARRESDKRNRARVARPLRNSYRFRHGGAAKSKTRRDGEIINLTSQDLPSLLPITDKIAAAAALVAEAELVGKSGNLTRRAPRAAAASKGSFWMQDLVRKGTVPWGHDPSYVVFRNVLDYGAVGDGVTDDTKAINKAMGTNSTRCDRGCNGSTTKNAIVYFPPGNYLVSSTIAMPFGTQVIGDANNRPTLVAAPSFVGLGVLSTDEYTGAGGAGIDGKDPEYFVNTANFYRQIRNIIIDIRNVKDGAIVTGIHYQVAQATSTQNVHLIAKTGTDQIGMFAENGSGGSISDITFTGGGIGLKAGSQQFTAQRLGFDGCDVGIQVIWDWGWVWKSITMKNVRIGFKLVGDDGVGNIGSVSILDSSFAGAEKAIVINPINPTPGKGSTGISLENVALSGVGVAVADTSGATILASSSRIDQWVVGPVYEGSSTSRSFSHGSKVGQYKKQSDLLDSRGNYFERPRPQYEDRPASAFVHTKDLGCAGDGSTDDTAAIQAALDSSVGKILFVDAGTYILTSTIVVPSGAKIVGETWSQLAASGPYFADATNPKVVIQVGNEGQTGNVEMQDLIFTTRGPTAGAIILQWNLKAESQGAAGLWDCHIRIGGATGTDLTPAECPPVTSGVNPGCSAASLMMHLTKKASGYFENMWLWGADHMIDDPDVEDPTNDMTQNSIYIARGFLIESTSPSWLYGTASEHAVFYQYNFHSASNIYAGMLQTESPYFQPTPPPPAPFADVVGDFPGDPDYTCAPGDEFSGCDESWSTIITGSENIFIGAAGIYSWFSTYSQDCIDTQQCQKALMLLKDNYANVRITNLITIGSKYMAVVNGKGILATDNLNVDVHPSWSQISVLDAGGNGTVFDEYIWIDPKIWDMEQPQFTCSPPCKVKIPPWTSATSTVNYPLITVSQGAWTSTITKAPLTITEWIFEAATVTRAPDVASKKKRAAETLRAVPATTPYWPAVIYNGKDGKRSTTSPTQSFPSPPKFMDAGAAPPPSGHWPKRDIELIFNWPENPIVPECTWLDFDDPRCVKKPWLWGNDTATFGDDGGGDDIENVDDSKTTCPAPTTSSTSTSTSTSTEQPTSTPSKPDRYAQGDPQSNKVKCYNHGENTENVRMENAATSFCDAMAKENLGPKFFKAKTYAFPYNGGLGTVSIKVSLQVKNGCSFGNLHRAAKRDLDGRSTDFDEGLCEHYLSVPTDSCNCGGKNGKQGGIVENDCYIFRIDPEMKL